MGRVAGCLVKVSKVASAVTRVPQQQWERWSSRGGLGVCWCSLQWPIYGLKLLCHVRVSVVLQLLMLLQRAERGCVLPLAMSMCAPCSAKGGCRPSRGENPYAYSSLPVEECAGVVKKEAVCHWRRTPLRVVDSGREMFWQRNCSSGHQNVLEPVS